LLFVTCGTVFVLAFVTLSAPDTCFSELLQAHHESGDGCHKTEETDKLNKDRGYVEQQLFRFDNCPKDSDTYLTNVQALSDRFAKARS
jgi:hypothetical protein